MDHKHHSIINYKGFGLKREILDKALFDKIREELTVKPNSIPDYDFNVLPFPVYRHNNKRVYVPKFYGIQQFGKPKDLRERHGIDININFNGSLRDDQKKFVSLIIKKLKKYDSCIACSQTGTGKTVMALNILSQIKKKTLIIVHKEFLLNQWLERIEQFIPNARIGIIRQEICDIEDKDIIIGMLQSISMKEYPKQVFEDNGLVIIDECHHICSRTFSQALFKVQTKNVLGLSATPKRKDGLTKVLKWFLGDIVENIYARKDNIEIPTVKMIKAEYNKYPKVKLNFKGRTNLPDLINQFVLDEKRNKIIIDQIIENWSKDRKILVLSDRRNHCVDLKVQLYKINPEICVGLYLGSMRHTELKESNECQVIIATYSMAQEGYDNSKLDTLLMATGKSDIEQAVGRILRKRNENPPLIIDICDSEYNVSQIKKRRQFYKKNKIKIIDYDDFTEDNLILNKLSIDSFNE